MNYIAAAYSDKGTVKETNQDSVMIKIANTVLGPIAFCMVCDGMGGLQSGEVASAFVIKTFEQWFHHYLPGMLGERGYWNCIRDSWDVLVKACNENIAAYGKSKGYSLGTTLSGVLVIKNQFLTVNVGDSRVYMVNEKGMTQVTKDQTVVAREIAEGRLTEEEAERDSRRSILLQCIGASDRVTPEYTLNCLSDSSFLLICSDGFRHELKGSEIVKELSDESVKDVKTIRKSLCRLTDMAKKRGEKDNITAAVIKAMG